MTMISSPSMEVTDVGDYLKLGACTAVMAQPILTDALASGPSIAMQTGIGVVYNLVKYTAPAFIFGILYTTTRLTLNQTALTYTDYLRQQWHALFIPTIWWTTIYLILMPQLQQGSQYHDWRGFFWQFVNGNAAPHLWYNTMMLQFIILIRYSGRLAVGVSLDLDAAGSYLAVQHWSPFFGCGFITNKFSMVLTAVVGIYWTGFLSVSRFSGSMAC